MTVHYTLIRTDSGLAYPWEQSGEYALSWLWVQAANHFDHFRVYVWATR